MWAVIGAGVDGDVRLPTPTIPPTGDPFNRWLVVVTLVLLLLLLETY